MSSQKLLPSKEEMSEVFNELVDKHQMPRPKGWKILVMMPKYKEQTKSKILVPDEYKEREENACPIGLVVAMGDSCYLDTKRFPSGPYCQEGDIVAFRAYSGTRYKIEDIEFRLINDDTVEAIVPDPQIIERV